MLPYDILIEIYRKKHELEFRETLELIDLSKYMRNKYYIYYLLNDVSMILDAIRLIKIAKREQSNILFNYINKRKKKFAYIIYSCY